MGTHVELRGQLMGVRSLFYHVASGAGIQVATFSTKCLNLLSTITGHGDILLGKHK